MNRHQPRFTYDLCERKKAAAGQSLPSHNKDSDQAAIHGNSVGDVANAMRMGTPTMAELGCSQAPHTTIAILGLTVS